MPRWLPLAVLDVPLRPSTALSVALGVPHRRVASYTGCQWLLPGLLDVQVQALVPAKDGREVVVPVGSTGLGRRSGSGSKVRHQVRAGHEEVQATSVAHLMGLTCGVQPWVELKGPPSTLLQARGRHSLRRRRGRDRVLQLLVRLRVEAGFPLGGDHKQSRHVKGKGGPELDGKGAPFDSPGEGHARGMSPPSGHSLRRPGREPEPSGAGRVTTLGQALDYPYAEEESWSELPGWSAPWPPTWAS